MGRIPIVIEKIKVAYKNYYRENSCEKALYLIKIIEKGQNWQRTFTCDRDDLIKLRKEIDELIENTTTAEILCISEKEAEIIDDHYKNDELCQNCSYKLKQNCLECLFTLQSPLERQLYLKLLSSFIRFQSQYPLNWYGEHISIDGKDYDNPLNNFKDVLTVVDFYIEKGRTKICVYVDGHTYHERTEDQAQRDKKIDRKLQELGFIVLRYTGKDIKENIEKVVEDIKNWLE
jgi:hypothetical protein